MSIRLILSTLAVVMLVVGTFAVALAAPQCGYMPQQNSICNYGGCTLTITFCKGDANTCPAKYLSTNQAGAYNCTYTGSKTDACVPALAGDGMTPLYSLCMKYEACEFLTIGSICQPDGFFYTPCEAPYYKRVDC